MVVWFGSVIAMLTTVEGVYRKGKIELVETPAAVNDARVLVTFLSEGDQAPMGAVSQSNGEDRLEFAADFAEARTIEMMAEEQRRFQASLASDLEDVDLPDLG
jgi:hypothetical protein